MLVQLALVAALFLVSIAAPLWVSLVAAIAVERWIGGGVATMIVNLCGSLALIGRYVAPHVQPRITAALYALLKTD